MSDEILAAPGMGPRSMPGADSGALEQLLNAMFHEGEQPSSMPQAGLSAGAPLADVTTPRVDPAAAAMPADAAPVPLTGLPSAMPGTIPAAMPAAGGSPVAYAPIRVIGLDALPVTGSGGAAPGFQPSGGAGAQHVHPGEPVAARGQDIPVHAAEFAIPPEVCLVPAPRDVHALVGSPTLPDGVELDTARTEPYWLAAKRQGQSIEQGLQPLDILPIEIPLQPTRVVENLPNPPRKPPAQPPSREFFIEKLTAMSGQPFAKADCAGPDAGTRPAHYPDLYWVPGNPAPAPAGVHKASGVQPVAADGFDVETVRKDFPILGRQVNGKPLVWLDNAATTQKPRAVIERISRYYEEENSNVHRGAHELAARATDAYEKARDKVRTFLGAGSSEEIVFTRGTTESINLVAKSWARQFLSAGDEIIVSELEHHSNIVPWQMVVKETGARIRVAPILDSGEIDLDAYQRLFNSRTRLVAIAHVSNALGSILPVRELTEAAHRQGAVVLVDGAQSVPHFPVNVQDIGADFYAMSGHKLFGPTGVGVLYAKRHLLEAMPPWQGGGNMIEQVSFEQTTYNPPPSKFEAGTGILAGAIGLGAAIDYLERIGFANAARYEDELLHYGQEQLSRIPGVRMIGTAREKAGVLSFVTNRVTPQQMGEILNAEGIAVRTGHHCAQPALAHYGLKASIRPSLAFYNTRAEIDHLVRTVDRAIRAAG